MKHTGMVASSFVVAAGLLLNSDVNAGSLEPPGPPAPTMKSLQQVEPRIPITSLPFVISAPGSYYVTGNLTGVSGQNGISIGASFVSIDLNGFTLTGVPGSASGIEAGANTKHITIGNGAVRSWGGSGIQLTDTIQAQVHDMRADGNVGWGVAVGPHSIVRATTAAANVNGIYALTGSAVVGCTAINNQTGIFLTGHGTVSDSTASSNTVGFLVDTGSTATDCAASSNAVAGFSLGSGSRVTHSAARQNQVGILAAGTTGVSIEECTANSNTDDGIQVSARARVVGNVAHLNTNDGIEATGNQNQIEDNEVTVNGTGIRLTAGTSGNLIVRNNAGNNTVEYSIPGGQKLGPISTDPATAGPWANFDL